jgi:hypothetical protein
MVSSLGALSLAGGLGASLAFLVGIAFARSPHALLLLAGTGALLVCALQALAGGHSDPVTAQLLNATAVANALGWLAGTLLVVRLRCLEWLEAHVGSLDAQEAT